MDALIYTIAIFSADPEAIAAPTIPVLLLGRTIVGIGNVYEEMNCKCSIEMQRDLLGYIGLTTMSHCSEVVDRLADADYCVVCHFRLLSNHKRRSSSTSSKGLQLI